MPKVVPYTKGSVVFFSGDRDDGRIFILQSGAIALTTQDLITGSNISEQLHQGEFFGVKSTFAHIPRMETASVLADSMVVVLSLQEFEKIFGPNQAVILKMLRVFSSELREIHKKTSSVLNNNVMPYAPEDGMAIVAKSFYDSEEYHSCVSVLEHILKRYPNAENKTEVEKMLKDASDREKHQRAVPHLESHSGSGDSQSQSVLRQFSLPIFERFSKKYQAGDVIICEFEEGDTFYLIQSGEIQLVKCINGQRKNLDILKPGEFFGEMAILDNSQRSATCTARGPAQCLEFNKDNFKLLITGNPQIAMILFRIFCKRVYDQRRRFKTLVIKDLSTRVADVFLMYDETTHQKNGSDETVKRQFDLTVADVAQWAGITVEQATDEINRYSRSGKLQVFDNYMVVHNILDMKRIVDSYYAAMNAV